MTEHEASIRAVALLAEHGRKAPCDRDADPEEIAESVAFLALGQVCYVFGAAALADGGISIAIP
ncbi:SDR family oxidoreductase [Propionivibrio soli]|uniref:SDR family oxidoreductase n=1 Tax=Propionivibrio soli TaxID=2976531 RepID=UPI003B84954F